MKEAKVASGDALLAALVEAAVLTWRFTPATRDGKPVAAKIHLRVVLRIPAPPTHVEAAPTRTHAPVPAPVPASAPASAPAPAPDGEEVVVRGTKPLAPHVEVLAAEIRELPGAFGDAFRAIESLPGVTPVLSGIPYFVIRGAPPGNTGFYLDDVRVPSLFHFAIGQAVIHPGLIESVDLYSGAYPAHYGRFAGGILAGSTIEPSEKMRGEASVRLLDAGALIEIPFANGQGSALVSGRVGYPGLLLDLLNPDVGLQYYDYQGRLSYRFRDGSELRLFGFGSYDSLSSSDVSGGPLKQRLAIEFERLALRYTKPLSHTSTLRVEATVGHDRVASESSTPAVALSSTVYSLTGELNVRANDATTLKVGGDLVYQPYRFDFGGMGASDPTNGAALGAILPTAQDDLTSGVYLDVTSKLSPAIDAQLGLRGDLFTASYPGQALTPDTTARQVLAFDPRLTVRARVAPRVRWISAFGVAHQASNIPIPVPALSFSQLSRGLQTAYQASEGVEVALPWEFTGTVTGFWNSFAGLAQLTNSCPSDAPPSCAATTVHGRSFGLEVFLRRNLTRRLTGWFAYTFSRSDRDAFHGLDGSWGHQLSEYDRPHVANLIVAYDLGAHWRAGGHFIAYSGAPYATGSLDGTPNARTPPFYRVDLRVEKRWPKAWGHISFIAEWLNVLLQKEQFGLVCENAGPQGCSPQLIGPITIPSLGVEAAF